MYDLLLKQPESTKYRLVECFTDMKTACRMADCFYPLREYGWEVKVEREED